MRQSILAIFIFSSLFINSSISNELKAQTVTTTIQYGGFVTTCCSAGTVDYFCFDSPSNTGYCGNTTTCNTQNFTDPVPAGNIVTQIAVSYTSAGCGGGVLTGSVNGTSLGSVTELNNGCPCTGLQWTPTGATTSNYPCGIVNAGITYNYGGLNSFQFCAAGQVCIDRAVLTISYVPASDFAPHMANYSGKHYYKRSGDSFYTCEHYDIKDMFQRRHSAYLDLNVKDKEIHQIQGGNMRVELILSLMNTGRNYAKAPLIKVEINKPYSFSEFGLDGNGNIGVFRTRSTPRTPQLSTYMGGQDIIIYPELEYDIDKIKLEISKDIAELPELVIRYMIVAENMEKTKFTKTITVKK